MDCNWCVPYIYKFNSCISKWCKNISANAAAAGNKNKVVINFNEISGNGIRVYYGGGFQKVYSVQDIIDNDLKIEETIEFVGGETLYIYSLTSSTYAVIDNVSVKEYLGQEVVPNSGCGSWLFEPQSTNLLQYSNEFSNANWNKSSNYTVQSNIGISPDGTLNASTITNTNGSGGFVFTTLPVLASTEYTVSFYAKRGTATEAKYSIYDGGDIVPSTSYYADITDSKYTRVSFSFTSLATSSTVRFYISRDDGAVGTVYVYGAQVEQKSYATSYIPTSGSTVTRNQDVCNNGATGAGLINSSEGVLYWEGAKLQAASGTQVIGLSDGSTANRISFQTTTTANQIMFVVDAGGQQASESFIVSDITDYNKFALKWKQDDFSFWINGIKVGTDTSGNVPPLNALNTLHFYYGTGLFNFFGKTKTLAVWKEALSDSELQSLTTI